MAGDDFRWQWKNVRRVSTLCGGLPFWYPCREGAHGPSGDGSARRDRLTSGVVDECCAQSVQTNPGPVAAQGSYVSAMDQVTKSQRDQRTERLSTRSPVPKRSEGTHGPSGTEPPAPIVSRQGSPRGAKGARGRNGLKGSRLVRLYQRDPRALTVPVGQSRLLRSSHVRVRREVPKVPEVATD